jgi:hypothetical protein
VLDSTTTLSPSKGSRTTCAPVEADDAGPYSEPSLADREWLALQEARQEAEAEMAWREAWNSYIEWATERDSTIQCFPDDQFSGDGGHMAWEEV